MNAVVLSPNCVSVPLSEISKAGGRLDASYYVAKHAEVGCEEVERLVRKYSREELVKICDGIPYNRAFGAKSLPSAWSVTRKPDFSRVAVTEYLALYILLCKRDGIAKLREQRDELDRTIKKFEELEHL